MLSIQGKRVATNLDGTYGAALAQSDCVFHIPMSPSIEAASETDEYCIESSSSLPYFNL